MILKGEIYKTPSGKAMRRGRDDTFRLVSETGDEAERLGELRRHGRLTYFRGSADRGRAVDDLRNTARAIDPKFKEDIRVIQS